MNDAVTMKFKQHRSFHSCFAEAVGRKRGERSPSHTRDKHEGEVVHLIGVVRRPEPQFASPLVVDEFGGEPGPRVGAGEGVGRDLPGGRHVSTSGPNRESSPPGKGWPRRNSSAVIRFFPAGWSSWISRVARATSGCEAPV